MGIQLQPGGADHTGSQDGPGHPGWSGMGVVFALCLIWLTLWLMGCASSPKAYVVDYTRGNDVTAQGSRERPCKTEAHCRMLAERDGVRSYWMVYQ